MLAAVAGPARAAETPQPVGHEEITVSADSVKYFSDEAVVSATGNVKVSLADGTAVEGDAFAMDLRLRRLIVAGHVVFRTPAGSYVGAAVSNFLEFRRVYFLPLVPAADRWTFLDGDYAHPVKGRDMPGDAFALPDLRNRRPYNSGRMATIDPSTFVIVQPAATAVLMGPVTPPLPAFVDNFSANPAFGENSLAGATFDAPYPFYGSSHTIEALHLRYDQARSDPYFLSFEHHSVADNGAFAVISLNPMTQPAKQWSLRGYVPSGSRAALSVSAQLFTTQSGLAQPSSSNGFADVQYVQALAQSSLLADATQSYDTFLPGAPNLNHPFVIGLAWNGYQQPVGKSGFTYRLTSGAAFVHDALGVSGQPETNVRTTDVGLTVATPTIAAPLGTTLFGTASIQRTWLSFPNNVTTKTLVVSDSKEVAPRLYGVVSASVGSVQTNDASLTIVSPNVATGLTAAPQSPNGLPVFQTPTTAAAATDRTYALEMSWQPTPAFQFTAAQGRSVYSPGQPIAPNQLALTVRADVTRTIFITVGRTYFYNWQNQAWSPRFSFQVSGQ